MHEVAKPNEIFCSVRFSKAINPFCYPFSRVTRDNIVSKKRFFPTDPTGFKPLQPAPQKQPKLSHFYPKQSSQNQTEQDSTGFKPTLTRPFGTKRSQVQILSPRPKTGQESPFLSGFFLPFAQNHRILTDSGHFGCNRIATDIV